MGKSRLPSICPRVTYKEKVLDSGTELSRVVKTLRILVLPGSCMKVGKAEVSVFTPEGDDYGHSLW